MAAFWVLPVVFCGVISAAFMDHKTYLKSIGSKGGKTNSKAQQEARKKAIAKVNAKRKKKISGQPRES